MEYAPLGSTGIKVSRISLGTAFRSEPPEDVCIAAIHRAADLGCNFLDCANVYRDGLSEEIVGKALKGKREQFVVTTKVGAPTVPGVNGGGLSRKSVIRDAEASLGRLKTDYIDLYLCHFPDPETPIDETLRAMDDLIRQGKIRYAGCSNFHAWQLCEARAISEKLQIGAFVCNQVLYNLLDRHVEAELIPYCRHSRVSMTVFASTAIGLLSGRFRYGQPPPPGTSWARGPYNFRAAMTREVDEVVQALIDIARCHERTPTHVSMAWCLTRPEVTSVITGSDTPERVDENFSGMDWRLSEEEIARLDSLSEGVRLDFRKDCPGGYQPDAP